MDSRFFQKTRFEQSLSWLFYIGLFLFLLSESICLPTEQAAPAVYQFQHIVGQLGRGLLFLRLLTLLPRHPRYVLVCFCLLASLKLSHILACPGSLRLHRVALVVAASRDAKTNTALKTFLAYVIFFLLACPISYLVGWTGNETTHFGWLQGDSFGFRNPNSLAAFITMAVFLGFYLSKERRAVVIWAVCWSAAILTYLLTLCVTQTLLLAILPVIYLLFQWKYPKPWVLAAVPVFCLAGSVILACYFGPGYGSTTFESRFSIPALVYEQYGLTPFGQNLHLRDWFKGEPPYYLPIDNGYLDIFLCKGVVMGIVTIAFFTHLLFLIGKNRDNLLSAVACCMMLSGVMECIPFTLRFAFLPLFYVPFMEKHAPASEKPISAFSFALALGVFLYLFMPWHPSRVRPHPNGTVADIPCPAGFARTEFAPGSFPGYLERLPLARADSVLACFDGTPCDSLERFSYRVVDFPLIDVNEQCADVCMRMRAEYLYGKNRFRKIRFSDTVGNVLRYHYGACRPLFDRYLKKVFAWCNTESMCLSMPHRPMKEIIPGDVLVYDKDSRLDEKYGHAVMVAAVAVDTLSGQTAVLLIEGSTPACDIHVIANCDAPELSPWHLLNESGSAPILSVGRAVFYEEDIRYFSDKEK